jgi:hypothetical protein
MGMLDRYKKKGGFFQLLQLLETSPIAKREQFLGLISAESPVWEDALRKRILTVPRIYSWDPQYLVEIFSRLQPLTLANALHGTSPEEVEKLLSGLPPISRRKITDMIAESNPPAAERTSCLMRVLTDVRSFISQGIIRLEKVDPELLVPEDIEEILYVTSLDSIAQTATVADTSTKGDEKSLPPSTAPEIPESFGAGVAELEVLKRKLNHLSSEVNALKHENSILKDKLAKIKKIA